MVIKPRKLPDRPDYKTACRQTVTLYNVYKSGGATHYHKTVFENSAFLDINRLWREQTTGSTANTNALLVIPQGASGFTFVPSLMFNEQQDKTGIFTVQENDKAVQGTGPDINTSTEWSQFIPSKVNGLMVIKAVDPKRTLDGDIAHIEAGG